MIVQKQKITPCLWFREDAEAAARFYVSTFDNSRISGMTRYGEAGPGQAGSVMSVVFELSGQEFIGLNGGKSPPFSEALSLSVLCETQAEIDRLWSTLTAGGSESRCGWLKDRYGVSWQIVPRQLIELLQDEDATRARRVMEAMFKMCKLDIARLQAAMIGGC